MPQTRGERMIYAAITVFITVNAFVFYSIFIAGSDDLTEFASLTASEQISDAARAVQVLGGIPMLGVIAPVWVVLLTEFCCAYPLVLLVSNPCAARAVSTLLDPRKTPHILIQATFACTTVGIMVPAMSFIAALLYYPWQAVPFTVGDLLLNWTELMCLNFPFAFFSQLFYIQPLVRLIFRRCVRREHHHAPAASQGRA